MTTQQPRGLAGLACLCALAALASAPAAGAAKDVLDNGLVVITSPSQGGDIAAIGLMVKASAVHEPAGKAGLRQLLQQTLVRGGERTSGDDLAEALDALGAEFEAAPGMDYVWLSLTFMGEDLERAVEVVAEVVRRPLLAEREIDGQREVALRYLRSLRGYPFESAQELVREGLYGDHPYGRPTQGTEESLKTITRDDLVDFHRRYYVPNNTVIAFAGAAPREAAIAAVRRFFGDWPRGEPPPLTAPPVPPLERSSMQIREAPVQQAYLMLGFGVGPPGAENYPLVDVIQSLLGRGMGARMFAAFRAGTPSAYEANAYCFMYSQSGYIAAYVVTDPDELESTKKAMLSQFEKLRSEPVTPTELTRAQEFAIGTHALDHQKARNRAFHLAWGEVMGLGWDFDERYSQAIRSVTAAQVQDAARAWFNRYSLGLVLPGG